MKGSEREFVFELVFIKNNFVDIREIFLLCIDNNENCFFIYNLSVLINVKSLNISK